MGTDPLSAEDRRLVERWRQCAVNLREEAGRIRRTIKAPTDAEERANVRAEIYDTCAEELAAKTGKEVVCNEPKGGHATPPGVATTAPGDSAHAYEAAYEAYRLLTHEMLHGGGLGGRCGLAQHVLSEVFTTKTNLATEEQMPSVYIERDALKSDNTLLREEVDRWKREAEAARNILHESGRERNVNHVLAVSPEIGRAAYKAARAAVDARIDLGEQP